MKTAFLFLLCCLSAGATTYYVSNAGSDSNNGTSTGTPWQTIAHVNAQSFSPGDSVLFNRGDTWREQLVTPSAGASGNQIVFGAYGTGSAPVITGADVVTGLTTGSAGTEASGDLLSEGWESGTTGWTLTQTGGTVATSTDFAFEGTHSLKIVGNGTSSVAWARRSGSSAAASGDTLYYFFRVYVPTGTMRTTTWRLMRIYAATTSMGFVQFTQNSSGVPVLATVNMTGPGSFVNNQSFTGFTLDSWNTLEIAVKVAASGGGVQIWLNGSLIVSNLTVNTSGLVGIDGLLVGNDASGTGPDASKPFYFDTVKMSKSPIGAYQSGSDPNLWTSTTPLAATPAQLFIDGERGQPMSSAASVVSYRQWYYDAGTTTLTVYGQADTEPSVEASTRESAVTIGNAYTTIQDLDLARGSLYAIEGAETGTVIQRDTARDAFSSNIFMSSGTLFQNDLIAYNDVHGAGADGILVNDNSLNIHILNNTVHENCQLSNSMPGGIATQQFSGGIKMWSGNTADHGAGALINGNVVYDNRAASWLTPDGAEANRGDGIWLDEIKIPTGTPCSATGNVVHDNQSYGMLVEKTQRCSATYNTSYNNASVNFTANMALSANSGVAELDTTMANNTVYGTGYWAVLIGGNTSDSSFTDNTFVNNLVISNTGASQLFIETTGADSASGNVIDYNLYGNSSTLSINASSATLGQFYTTLSSWQSASGQDAHSQYVDPLLTNAAGHDFTLTKGSPARNAALRVLNVDGQQISEGVPDIGAFEYAPGKLGTNSATKLNNRYKVATVN